MAVYVDRPRKVDPWGPGRWKWACHLYADQFSELHAFAQGVLGLKREYFQDHPRFPHYDLTRSKLELAVARGAVRHETRREFLAWFNGPRQTDASRENMT